MSSPLRRASSTASSTPDALAEIHRALAPAPGDHLFFFAAPGHDRDEIERFARDTWREVSVVGCTTAGEIGTSGYLTHGFSAFVIAGGYATIRHHRLRPLATLDAGAIGTLGLEFREALSTAREHDPRTNAFGLLMVDGLSVREERVIGQLHAALGNVALVGGSAGDELGFEATFVFHDGCFHPDAAVVSLVLTVHPFRTFRTQHFVPTDVEMVITRADAPHRVVHEINGRPAAPEYARLLGVGVDELEAAIFSHHPVMLLLGSEYYVRSIQTANPDGSLTFYCAIDEGLVLTLAEGRDFVEALESTLTGLRADVPDLEMIVGYECVLRRLEVLDTGIEPEVSRVMAENRVIGFHTYGEQYRSVHVNQTFTGVALGRAA